MKFHWTPEEKERYFRKAEKQLKNAGIDFVSVDRKQFGTRGWDEQSGRVQAVYISLTPYPFSKLSTVRKGILKRLGNWQCVNPRQKKRKSQIGVTDAAVYMCHRLVYEENRGKKKCRKETGQKKTGCTSSGGQEPSHSRTE